MCKIKKTQKPGKLCECPKPSKLSWNDTFVIPFQKYGQRPEQPTNMATTII
jgi:hypothetical protein